MTKHPLIPFAFLAPADTGSGAAANVTVTAAPAPAAQAAPEAPRALSVIDLAASFQKQQQAVAQKPAEPASKEPAPETPASPAQDPATAGSDAGQTQAPGSADAPTDGPTPDAEDVKPPEGISPERAAQIQKGIDKLKAREEAARKEAAELRAELDALKAKPTPAAEPAPAPTPEPAALLPLDGNPLFSAASEDEVIARHEHMQHAILAGKRLLATMDRKGLSEDDDTIPVRTRDGEVEVTRAQLLREIQEHESLAIGKDRALRLVAQRREVEAKTRQAHPDLFPGGKPSDKVLAVLAEIPALRQQPDGLKAAAEIAAARVLLAKGKALATPAPAQVKPTPAKPAPAPLPVPAADAPAVLPSQSGTHPTPPTGKRGLTVHDVARAFAGVRVTHTP